MRAPANRQPLNRISSYPSEKPWTLSLQLEWPALAHVEIGTRGSTQHASAMAQISLYLGILLIPGFSHAATDICDRLCGPPAPSGLSGLLDYRGARSGQSFSALRDARGSTTVFLKE